LPYISRSLSDRPVSGSREMSQRGLELKRWAAVSQLALTGSWARSPAAVGPRAERCCDTSSVGVHTTHRGYGALHIQGLD